MPLEDFLASAENTHAREEIFTNRLIYELKIAAASERNYHLLNYYSDVDHDGFDAIFDDRDHVERTQLKTVFGDTQKWPGIKKYLLRPTLHHWESFSGLHFNSPGVEGSVIVTDITIDGGTPSVSYWFTNVLIIYSISTKILIRSPNTQTAATALLNNLAQGASTEPVAVTKRMFVPASSPVHLLALMGLHTRDVFETNWRYLIVTHANNNIGNQQIPLPAPLPQLSQIIRESLQVSSGQAEP